MQVKVLKPFPYSPDGHTKENKVKDDEFDCRDELIEGLVAEGYIAKPKAVRVTAEA